MKKEMKKEMKKDYHETDNRLAEITAVFTEILESIFGENAPTVEVVLAEPQEAKAAEGTESVRILELMLEKDCDITQRHVKWLRTSLSGEKDSEQDYMDTIFEELLHDLLDFAEMLECLAMMLLVSEGKDCSKEDLTVASEIMKQVCRDLEKWEEYQLLTC